MKPEDKVPLKEQCRRLKELGVVLETEKYWQDPEKSWDHDDCWLRVGICSDNPESCIPAPDVAELRELLGSHINQSVFRYSAWDICAVLIWLIENGYFKQEDK